MMPRYFFDICNGGGRIPDEEGTDCTDLNAAILEAAASARDLVKQYVDSNLSISGCYIAVRDEHGDQKVRFPLVAALDQFH